MSGMNRNDPTAKSHGRWWECDWVRLLSFTVSVLASYILLRVFFEDSTVASDFVLIATASVIVWYTLETSRIRKQGDERAEVEAAPVVGFSLSLRDDPHEPSLWFEVRNYTRNPAILRVLVRLRTSAGTGRFTGGAYAAQADWELAEHQYFRGWFSLIDLLAGIQGERMKTLAQQAVGQQKHVTWPADAKMQIDLQVAVYDRARILRRMLHQEFVLVWPSQSAPFQLWPEVAPASFADLDWPTVCPAAAIEFTETLAGGHGVRS